MMSAIDASAGPADVRSIANNRGAADTPDEASLHQAALWYAAHGFPVFPCKPRGKEPLTPHGFKDASTDPRRITEWWARWPDANVGIPTGVASGLLAVDIDPRNGGDTALDGLISKHGALPGTAEQETGGGGRHVFFKDLGCPLPGELANGIDIQGQGAYVLVAPSIHPNGARYRWDGVAGAAALLNPAHVPNWLLESFVLAEERKRKQAKSTTEDADRKVPAGQRNNYLTSAAGTMRRRGMSQGAIEAALLAENHSRCDPPLEEREVKTIAKSVARYEPDERVLPDSGLCDATADPTEAGAPPDLLPLLPNDHGNACRLIALYGEELRYCHAFKKWLVWDGMRWAVDETDQALRLAKQTVLEFLRQAVKNGDVPGEKFARGSLDAKRLTNMLRLAESEIFVRPHELDTDPYLLNFLNGTVDLRNGRIREHQQADLITKLVRYRYRSEAQCSRWIEFLNQVMGGGPGANADSLVRAKRLTDYLQRACGYSLTGCTIEKAVFVLFGPPDRGKSTMLTTFRRLIEEYSQLLQVETLMTRQESNNTQADLADLRGARFVQTSEAEEGQQLSQGKLKRITQGMGKIKAVRKYENPIEFPESHKLWLDTNRKPVIRDVDDSATFNRLHPIPFTVKIPTEQIDKQLPQRLLAEAEGILAWAVAGAKLWYESGLAKPAEVEAAKNEWHDEMDQVGRFLEERCVLGDGFRAQASVLYADYKRWAEEGGQRALINNTQFGLKLPERGFSKEHSNRGTIYLGVGLRQE